VSAIPLHIDKILRSNGIILNEEKKDQLGLYFSLLKEWNQRINLVSRRDTENIWESHILHSISPLFLLNIPSGVRMLDLGSGGGLPGIPLAIVHGGLEMVLMDSIQKKAHALHEILAQLELPGIQVITGRAEELGKGKRFAALFDAVIARAVAPLDQLVRWAAPFLRKRALASTEWRSKRAWGKSEFSFPYLLALKGGDLNREIGAVRLKHRTLAITELNLIFPGSESLDLVDKKLVVVEYQ
jgi:16S rRNA (guanine527-N7)-methyltransferase